MKFLYFFLIILYLPLALNSQVDRHAFNLEGDSLMESYKVFSGTEFEEFLQLKNIIRHTVDVNMDTAVHYYTILDSIASKSSDSTIIMETKYLGGAIFVIDYKPEKAKPLILDYIDYCTRRNDHENLGKSHRFMAATYTLLTEHDKSIYHSLRAQEFISREKYAIQFNNRARIARSYNLMGDPQRAIESWQWYLDSITSADEHYTARVHGHISDIYFDMNKLDSAITHTKKFAPVAERLNMTSFIHKAKINIARIELLKGNILEAERLAKESFLLFKEYPESYLAYLQTHKIMAEAAIFKNETAKAKSLLRDGLNLARKRKLTKEEIYFTKTLLKLEINLQKNSKGEVLMDSLLILTERLSEESKKQALYTIHKQYDVEKKEIEIDLLKATNELAIAKSERAKKNTILALLGALSLGIIAFLLNRSLAVKKKSERMLTEKNNIISSALSEKELLLKEIHHRVKNNLQVVSSLLSLQSEYIKDDSALSAINEGRNRVRSMALIHQNLYSEDNLTGINVKSYLEKLISGLFESYNINEDKIELSLDISNIELDVDIVVPLGLIANELVSNALKHAFTDQKRGTVSVKLVESASGVTFSVKDNGKGMDVDQNLEDLDSFGYQMMTAFKEKLGAELTIGNEEGTEVELYIKTKVLP